MEEKNLNGQVVTINGISYKLTQVEEPKVSNTLLIIHHDTPIGTVYMVNKVESPDFETGRRGDLELRYVTDEELANLDESWVNAETLPDEEIDFLIGYALLTHLDDIA